MALYHDETYQKLLTIRKNFDLKLKPNPYLTETFTGLDGQEHPFSLRNYQVQMVLHLLAMKRFVVGDDTGTGKTLMVTGGLTYVWANEGPTKTLILTTKSAVLQWAGEFAKFTKGVTTYVYRGTPKQREKIYKAWQDHKNGPCVLISNYRLICSDFTTFQNWKGGVVVLDECFQYHTPITLADGTTELIGKIVSQKMPVEVLSWNPTTGKVEPRKVVDWHRNPVRSRNLVHLKFRFGGKVRVTANHKFYTPDGSEVPAGKLRKGMEVQHLCRHIPSDAQWQVVLGGLLGDSSMSHPTRARCGVSFGHSEKQSEYLKFKRSMLEPLGVSEVDSTPNMGFPLKDGGEKGYGRFRLDGNEAVASFLAESRVRRDNAKRITVDWLDRVGSLGLAFWYADDGSLSEHTCKDGKITRSIVLSTQGFSREEVELLAGWLKWKWGLDAEVKVTKPRTDRTTGEHRKSYPYIYLSSVKGAADQFLNLLPCGFPGVMYKFPGKPQADLADFDLTPQQGLVTDWVAEKSVWTPPASDKDKYVYNLEVEDNHNYFANGSLVSNCTAFKNTATQVFKVIRHIASQSSRVWGATATLIKNSLMEGYSIYQVIVPGLFPNTMNKFMTEYCVLEMMSIPGRAGKIPKVVGYLPSKVAEFRDKMDPFYLGRPKHEVASELPALTTKIIEVGLSDEQEAKYADAVAGLLTVKNEEKDVSKLTSLIYCQQIVNDLSLIGAEGSSDKVETLVDLLTGEGEFAEDKVILFTRFKSMVDVVEKRLKKEGLKVVRVTGDEKDTQRQEAQKQFQDFKSGVNVICITMAGGDAINLQAAKAVIFIDTPWSAGDLIQIVGRMIRVGSLHANAYSVHLVAKRPKGSIDQHVMKIMGKKMQLLEKVLGKRIKEGDDELIESSRDVDELYESLKGDIIG